MYLILGFLPNHNLMGILKTDLDGTKLSKYVVVSKAYSQGRVE
jgi:hypothetical protein